MSPKISKKSQQRLDIKMRPPHFQPSCCSCLLFLFSSRPSYSKIIVQRPEMSYLWLEVHFSDLLTSSLSENNALSESKIPFLCCCLKPSAVVSKPVYFALNAKISRAFIILLIDFWKKNILPPFSLT